MSATRVSRYARLFAIGALLSFPGAAAAQDRVRDVVLNGGLSVEAYRGNLAAATASAADSTDRAAAAIGELGASGTIALLEQERRSAELERLAASVERQKLVEADCVTPRSIIRAAGL